MTRGPRQKSLKSAIALAALLSEVQNSPHLARNLAGLVGALESQSKLAAFELPERGIVSVALNTLKKSAEIGLPQGFEQLDRLRESCRASLSQPPANSAKSKSSRSQLSKEFADLRNLYQVLHEDLMFMTDRFYHVLDLAGRYASDAGPASEENFRKERRELLQSIGLRPIKSDD